MLWISILWLFKAILVAADDDSNKTIILSVKPLLPNHKNKLPELDTWSTYMIGPEFDRRVSEICYWSFYDSKVYTIPSQDRDVKRIASMCPLGPIERNPTSTSHLEPSQGLRLLPQELSNANAIYHAMSSRTIRAERFFRWIFGSDSNSEYHEYRDDNIVEVNNPTGVGIEIFVKPRDQKDMKLWTVRNYFDECTDRGFELTLKANKHVLVPILSFSYYEMTLTFEEGKARNANVKTQSAIRAAADCHYVRIPATDPIDTEHFPYSECGIPIYKNYREENIPVARVIVNIGRYEAFRDAGILVRNATYDPLTQDAIVVEFHVTFTDPLSNVYYNCRSQTIKVLKKKLAPIDSTTVPGIYRLFVGETPAMGDTLTTRDSKLDREEVQRRITQRFRVKLRQMREEILQKRREFNRPKNKSYLKWIGTTQYLVNPNEFDVGSYIDNGVDLLEFPFKIFNVITRFMSADEKVKRGNDQTDDEEFKDLKSRLKEMRKKYFPKKISKAEAEAIPWLDLLIEEADNSSSNSTRNASAKMKKLRAYMHQMQLNKESANFTDLDVFQLSIQRGLISPAQANFNYQNYLPRSSPPAAYGNVLATEGKLTTLSLLHTVGLVKNPLIQLDSLPNVGTLYFYPEKTRVTAFNYRSRLITSGLIYYKDALQQGEPPSELDGGTRLSFAISASDGKATRTSGKRPYTYLTYALIGHRGIANMSLPMSWSNSTRDKVASYMNATDLESITQEVTDIYWLPTNEKLNLGMTPTLGVMPIRIKEVNNIPNGFDHEVKVSSSSLNTPVRISVNATDVDSTELGVIFKGMPRYGFLIGARFNSSANITSRTMEKLSAYHVMNNVAFNTSEIFYVITTNSTQKENEMIPYVIQDSVGGTSSTEAQLKIRFVKDEIEKDVYTLTEDFFIEIQLVGPHRVPPFSNDFIDYSAENNTFTVTALPSFGQLYQYDSSSSNELISSTAAAITSIGTLVTDPQARLMYVPNANYFNDYNNRKFNISARRIDFTYIRHTHFESGSFNSPEFMQYSVSSSYDQRLQVRDIEFKVLNVPDKATAHFSETLPNCTSPWHVVTDVNPDKTYLPLNITFRSVDGPNAGYYKIYLNTMMYWDNTLEEKSFARLGGDALNAAINNHPGVVIARNISLSKESLHIDNGHGEVTLFFYCTYEGCKHVLENLAITDFITAPHKAVLNIAIWTFEATGHRDGELPQTDYEPWFPSHVYLRNQPKQKYFDVWYQNFTVSYTGEDYEEGYFMITRTPMVFGIIGVVWPYVLPVLLFIIARVLYAKHKAVARERESEKPLSDSEFTAVLGQLRNIFLSQDLQAATLLLRSSSYDLKTFTMVAPENLTAERQQMKYVILQVLTGILVTEQAMTRFIASLILKEVRSAVRNDEFNWKYFFHEYSDAGMTLRYYLKHIGSDWLSVQASGTANAEEFISNCLDNVDETLPVEIVILCQFAALRLPCNTLQAAFLIFVKCYVAPFLKTTDNDVEKWKTVLQRILNNTTRNFMTPAIQPHTAAFMCSSITYLHAILHSELKPFSLLGFEEKHEYQDCTVVARTRQIVLTLRSPALNMHDVLCAFNKKMS